MLDIMDRFCSAAIKASHGSRLTQSSMNTASEKRDQDSASGDKPLDMVALRWKMSRVAQEDYHAWEKLCTFSKI